MNIKATLRLLVNDGVMLNSWLIFLGAAVLQAYFLSGHFGTTATPFDVRLVFSGAAMCGYWAWSLYWGIPPCFALLRRTRGRLLIGCAHSGCIAIGVWFGATLMILLLYPPLGGGIFHFFRRWSAMVEQLPPADLLDPVPNDNVEERLLVLSGLLARGVITQDEYDRLRVSILTTL